MTQGQGRHTVNKIHGIEAAFKQNVAIVSRGIGGSRYYHFDMNAGSGWNDKAGCYGSPIAFRAAACASGMPHAFCFACEKDRESAKRLAHATRDDRYTYVVHGANQDFAEMIPEIIRRFGDDPTTAYGSVFLDPNDHNSSAIPYRELRSVSEQCPRIDVLFNFPQLAMKRVVSAVAKGTHRAAIARDCFDIDEMPEVIGKRHLWIRQVSSLGNFALIVGRNTDNIKHDRNTGLATWDSENGLWYRERCRLPVDEADRRHAERVAAASGQRLLAFS